ncbi:hypothetical protein BN57_1804 [Bifidobacterium longum subsp. longum CECT 7347]|nr:hypothetical protein BN57_1804 [Bifidobacterium longum subsp. longum CECT 7347]
MINIFFNKNKPFELPFIRDARKKRSTTLLYPRIPFEE